MIWLNADRFLKEYSTLCVMSFGLYLLLNRCEGLTCPLLLFFLRGEKEKIRNKWSGSLFESCLWDVILSWNVNVKFWVLLFSLAFKSSMIRGKKQLEFNFLMYFCYLSTEFLVSILLLLSTGFQLWRNAITLQCNFTKRLSPIRAKYCVRSPVAKLFLLQVAKILLGVHCDVISYILWSIRRWAS